MTQSNFESNDDTGLSTAGTLFYDLSATLIFLLMSFLFLFPCNYLIPLDRRTAAVLSATLCYLTRAFLFQDRRMDLIEAVDFDVLVLLTSIMAINFLIVNQKETKVLVNKVQFQIQQNPERGFWLVSLGAFVLSPFLTNDGVCLLFVEPILNAFNDLGAEQLSPTVPNAQQVMKLEKSDVIYFLLSLACSSNIGSALTYTGNPQNMIVASDAIQVLPPYMFLGYMLIPSVFSWLITTWWIKRCWKIAKSKASIQSDDSSRALENQCSPYIGSEESKETKHNLAIETISNDLSSNHSLRISIADHEGSIKAHEMVLSPRSRGEEGAIKAITAHVVKAPFPYAVILLMLLMIILIFFEIMSIAGLVCVTAVLMIVVTVCGNYWKNQLIWSEVRDQELGDVTDDDHRNAPLSPEEKTANTNEFFEMLFNSIDYSLLLIFLGTFIVVANIESTGLPNKMWNLIVGETPFNTTSSVIGISLFVLISSQLIGNVAVIQLAIPNVSSLGPFDKRYAWAVLSFVATVGGNLTITGSAANIIVAEKATRLDSTLSIDFFVHYRICFWVTLLSCALGTLIITLIVSIDNSLWLSAS